MPQLYTNNALSTLASGISSGATSLTLATGTGARFPSPTGSDYFLATLTQAGAESSWEIVKVTARSGDVLTIVRAQDSTSAASWSTADKVELRLLASAATRYEHATVSVATTAPTSPIPGDLWWNAEEGALKLYYNDGSTSQWVDASAAGASGLTPILTTKVANYTITSIDNTVYADVSGGTFSLTLPAASTCGGQLVTLGKYDSSTTIVTIARTGSDTFEGWSGSQTSLHLRLQYQTVTLQSDGVSKWLVVDRYVPHVSCLATSSATTTSTSGAETAVTLNSESWDTHAMHDTVTNNSRITVPASGRYRVRFRNRWATGGNADSPRDTFVRKNGTGNNWYLFALAVYRSAGDGGLVNGDVGLVDLVGGDYLEMTQSAGDAITRANQVFANLYPEFEVTLVEPLV